MSDTQFPSLLLSDFFLFCSVILSHPLYFSYFIFFSPYLLKLLSFLSPLFITTSLLLLTLLTISPGLINNDSTPKLSEPKMGFLLPIYHTILERLESKLDNENDDFHNFEECEVYYRIVFDTSTFDIVGNRIEEGLCEFAQMEEQRLECLFKELDGFENMGCNVEEKKIVPPGWKSNKVVEEGKEKSLVGSGSEATSIKLSDNTIKGREYASNAAPHYQTLDAHINVTGNGGEYTSKIESLGSNLGAYGSMRKEKEWKRTLACKLFEERNNVEGDEGMDSLWETYETDTSKAKARSDTKKKNKKKDEDEDDEEEDETNGQLCCLQALKFSAGKMNLGMGRPNLVRISKALKGIGWLHRVSRHGRKK